MADSGVVICLFPGRRHGFWPSYSHPRPPQSWLEPPRDRHQRMTKQEEFCRTYTKHSDRLRAEPARGWKQYCPVWPRATTAHTQAHVTGSHKLLLGTDMQWHMLR